jgi:hypothetical protein
VIPRKRAPRLLSLAGLAGATALLASACDVSPYAANVNGHVLTVNTLNHQLAEFSSNRAFVQEFNASESASAQQTGAPAISVAGAGGSGTYSTQFVGQVLAVDVEIDAVHHYLAGKGTPATPDEILAARAVEEVAASQFWDQFPTDVRNLLVEQLADEGALTPLPSDPTSVQSAYAQISANLFSSICVTEATAFSASAAQDIIASGVVNGAQTCLTQADLEREPGAFRSAVLGLHSVGQISAPVPTSFGFEVLRLVSHSSPGLSPGVQQVLAATNNPPQALQGIVTSARVKINPGYGTWSGTRVTPPPSPLS